MQAGKKDEAVADLENAAQAVPSRAVVLYVQAANVLSQGDDAPTGSASRPRPTRRSRSTPNDARANYVAGIALANAGRQAKARLALLPAKGESERGLGCARCDADIDRGAQEARDRSSRNGRRDGQHLGPRRGDAPPSFVLPGSAPDPQLPRRLGG